MEKERERGGGVWGASLTTLKNSSFFCRSLFLCRLSCCCRVVNTRRTSTAADGVVQVATLQGTNRYVFFET